MKFSLKDVEKQFDTKCFELGVRYAKNRCVKQISVSGHLIRSQVKELTRHTTYWQNIFIKSTSSGLVLTGTCNCSEGVNCHHVVATLVTHLIQEQKKAKKQVEEAFLPLTNWIDKLKTNVKSSQAQSALSTFAQQKIIFILSPDASTPRLLLSMGLLYQKASSKQASIQRITDCSSFLAKTVLSKNEEEMTRLFIALQSKNLSSSHIELKGRLGHLLLKTLLKNNALYWTNNIHTLDGNLLFPMSKSEDQIATFKWVEDNKTLKLKWAFRDSNEFIHHVIATEPAWYINHLSCGLLHLHEHEQNDSVISCLYELLAQTPLLNTKDKQTISKLLIEHGVENIIPVPEILKEITIDTLDPEPVLTLSSYTPPNDKTSRAIDFARLSFKYGQHQAFWNTSLPLVRINKQGTLERIVRDDLTEATFADLLLSFGFSQPEDSHPLKAISGAFILDSEKAWFDFTQSHLEFFKEEGWEIIKDDSFRYNITPVDEYCASVNSYGEKGYFLLNMGIRVKEVTYPLFPLLASYIRLSPDTFNYQTIDSYSDDDMLPLSLPNGIRTVLPWGKLKPILKIFGELRYAEITQNALPYHRFDCSRLAQINEAFEITWTQDYDYLSLGKKFLDFKTTTLSQLPKSFNGVLRDYQLQGVAWMQFLREYELAGILADDMGLGKTIQTLAHILLEKEAGRLKKPALIVAPTSLMSNWQSEASHFTPNLSVLILQGKDRINHFSEIANTDIVLTTYALLPRDEAVLSQQEFHLLILDESQYIKNIHSKATQVVSRLQAKHKLCLTGTPLENNLSELWSQFHFLMPELLGSEKTFNREFRYPIEKLNDVARQSVLAHRISPFLLRRTKDTVAQELPPKTEMIRFVDFNESQRSLYNTTRSAMNKKIMSNIDKLGINQSQILILDALLKLRQICCDPRLLSTKKYQKVSSSKFDALITMVDELLQEGRHILIFSQFTSMLSLIEESLKQKKIDFALLTGETQDRANQVKRFQNGEVSVFLISLKAGGVGLNLTSADTVIHYDPWWNPAVENQATDRAWRIGQDKPVFVYKLIARNSLEEYIVSLQDKKAKLAETMLSSDQFAKTTITKEDLQAIFEPLKE